MNMEISVWSVTPCSLVQRYPCRRKPSTSISIAECVVHVGMPGQIYVVITIWYAVFKTLTFPKRRNTGAVVGACAFAKLRKANVSFVMSVCLSAWNSSAPTGRIFLEFDIWVFFENRSRKFKFNWNLTRITGTLHEDVRTYVTVIQMN
jgi:hypothetical protein